MSTGKGSRRLDVDLGSGREDSEQGASGRDKREVRRRQLGSALGSPRSSGRTTAAKVGEVRSGRLGVVQVGASGAARCSRTRIPHGCELDSGVEPVRWHGENAAQGWGAAASWTGVGATRGGGGGSSAVCGQVACGTGMTV